MGAENTAGEGICPVESLQGGGIDHIQKEPPWIRTRILSDPGYVY